MNVAVSTAQKVWKSAQLLIGFHQDQRGRQRDVARVWPPKNASAGIHADPAVQECFLVVKGIAKDQSQDVQVKLREDQIVVRREPGLGWTGVVIEEGRISVRVGDTWVRIAADGTVGHEMNGDKTYIDPDGSVLKKTEFAEAMISGDGVELSRRTEGTIAAIGEDGIIAKNR